MKGHARLVVAGADETTQLAIFTVGRATELDQSIFRNEVTYDGVADVALVALMSSNGKFGGLRAANATFFASQGATGVFAPGVDFTGPVYVGDITAFDTATPVLVLGAVTDASITGGDLLQDNG